MKRTFVLIVLSLALIGCESTGLRNDLGASNPANPPIDDRGNHDQTHRGDNPTPVWPADVDTGGGSGTR